MISEVPTYTPRYVLELLGWLPDDAVTVASMRGGRQWLGWTQAARVAADAWDLQAAVAVGQGGKKAARQGAPTYPRPKAPVRVAGGRRKVRRLSAFPGAINTEDFSEPPVGA